MSTDNNHLIIDVAQKRNALYRQIRNYFHETSVMEVETPILSHYASTDFHLDSFVAASPFALDNHFYLQTSPEFFMKRLLCEGSGDIFQICKVFRVDEAGSRHNPEFTMLEWYRLGFNLNQLMLDVAALLKQISSEFDKPLEFISYREVFLIYLGINPFTASVAELQRLAEKHVPGSPILEDKDDYLSLLLSACIEPYLGQGKLSFLYQYPASQAALAKTKTNADGELVAERFELYYQGIELANGFDELSDANEQQQRFIEDNELRRAKGKTELPYDKHLIDALSKGMPECAGVAVGLDRLLMLAHQAKHIDDILLFAFEKT